MLVIFHQRRPVHSLKSLVDCDGLEGGDGVDDDSLQEFFVQYYGDCFRTLCEVLGECLGKYDYAGDSLVAVDLEARKAEAMEVVKSLATGDVAGFAERTSVCPLIKIYVSKFVNTVTAKYLLEFGNSVPEMVLGKIHSAKFYEAKKKAISNAVAVLVD